MALARGFFYVRGVSIDVVGAGLGQLNRVTERRSGRQVAAREATRDGSRGIAAIWAAIRTAKPRALAIGVLGVAAAVLLVVAEFSPVFSITTLTASCEDLASPGLRDACVTTGGEQHSWALLLLGALTAVMTWGTAVGRSRPAAVALCIVGLVVVLIAVALDLPDADQTGEIGISFTNAEASPGSGMYLELVGGALALCAGALGLSGPRGAGRAAD
jgi:hypothetical protein